MIAPVSVQATPSDEPAEDYKPVVVASASTQGSKPPAIFPHDYTFMPYISRKAAASKDSEGI